MEAKLINDEQVSPYDKLGQSMLKKAKVKSVFKKKKEKGNQNAMKQQKFEHEIMPFDEFNFINEIYTSDLQNIPTEGDIIANFREMFIEKYPFVNCDCSDNVIRRYLAQKHINNLPLEKAVDFFFDYVTSQGLADVEE